jgi:hypothetical protein
MANSEAKVTARAQRFVDDYNRAILLRDGTFDESLAWVAKNPLVTSEYKRALAKAYRDAQEKDPEFGYGADAVICEEVFPEKGLLPWPVDFELDSLEVFELDALRPGDLLFWMGTYSVNEVKRVCIEGPLAFVLLSSREPEFKHVIHARFVKQNGNWLLEGTGMHLGGAFEAAQEKVSDAELTRRMVGDWQSPRHAYRYYANGTWKMEPNMPEVTTKRRWRIRNGFLESPPANPARALKIRVLNDEVTYQEDQIGTMFRMEAIQ